MTPARRGERSVRGKPGPRAAFWIAAALLGVASPGSGPAQGGWREPGRGFLPTVVRWGRELGRNRNGAPEEKA